MRGRIVVGQSVPAALAACEVITATGTRALGTSWAERDCVLVCIRHFACIGCAEQVTALRPRLHELERLRVAVVICGSGSADQLAGFVEREQLARTDVECVTDPTLGVYLTLGFQRSFWGTYGPIALGQASRAWLNGHSNGAAEGDLYQQGGVLYVRRGGEVAFYYRAKRLGDHARLVDVVDIALAARALEAST